MYFLLVKSLHIIFIVTWFAGLFYIVRLFVYFSETKEMEEPARSILQRQYNLMQKRLWYGITWPSAILTAILGTLLTVEYGFIPSWLWIKLCFVAALYVYHFYCHKIVSLHQKGIIPHTSFYYRIMNEVSTLILFSVVFLVVLKDSLKWMYGLGFLLLLTILIFMAASIYRKIRNSKQQE